MNYFINALITSSIIGLSLYIYDTEFVRNYQDFNYLSVTDEEERTRVEVAEYRSDEINRNGISFYDREGNPRIFIGTGFSIEEPNEKPILAFYDEDSNIISSFTFADQTSMLSVGPTNAENSVFISSSESGAAVTVIGNKTNGKTTDATLFAAKSPILFLDNFPNVTVLHAKPDEKGVIVLENNKRIWNSGQ